MKKVVLALAIVAVFFACNKPAQSDASNEESSEVEVEENLTPEQEFVKLVETTHAKEDFLGKEAISFDIQVLFGGNEIVNSQVILSTDSQFAKLDYKDGKVLITNGMDAYSSQEVAGGDRFHAYTWSYFFLLPFKMSDEGTKWTLKEGTDSTRVAKLEFESGTGDAPDDWYIFNTKENGQIDYVAYIVTAGATKEEAEKEPHAIVYKNYQMIDGVPIATEWDFRNWTTETGLGDKIGEAKISNVKFVAKGNTLDVPDAYFKVEK